MYVYLQLTWSNLVIFGQGSKDLKTSEVASINIYHHKLFFFFIKKSMEINVKTAKFYSLLTLVLAGLKT